jgi:hypothetical protein
MDNQINSFIWYNLNVESLCLLLRKAENILYVFSRLALSYKESKA